MTSQTHGLPADASARRSKILPRRSVAWWATNLALFPLSLSVATVLAVLVERAMDPRSSEGVSAVVEALGTSYVFFMVLLPLLLPAAALYIVAMLVAVRTRHVRTGRALTLLLSTILAAAQVGYGLSVDASGLSQPVLTLLLYGAVVRLPSQDVGGRQGILVVCALCAVVGAGLLGTVLARLS